MSIISVTLNLSGIAMVASWVFGSELQILGVNILRSLKIKSSFPI
jgi:hypothetical protein